MRGRSLGWQEPRCRPASCSGSIRPRVGAAIGVKQVAGEEEAIAILASMGEQVARNGYPYVTFRLVSDGTTWLTL